MTRLAEIAELDRRWFELHPSRRYRGRHAMPAERQMFNGGDNLVLLIRNLGRGLLVHQPVILSRPPPADENAIATLFDRAARDPLPIPVLEEPESTVKTAEPAD